MTAAHLAKLCPNTWSTRVRCHVFFLIGPHRCILKPNHTMPCMCSCGLEPGKTCSCHPGTDEESKT